MIKLCLLSLGILLGLYFYNYLVGLIWLWWVIFAVTAVYFVANLFKKHHTI